MRIREAKGVEDLAALHGVFTAIWGERGSPEVHLLRAVHHAGGYAALAEAEDGTVLGASFGFLGGEPNLHLHSHITGVLPDAQNRHVGFELKQHQRRWCMQRAIPRIRWTFDPLVRRNAWFNLRRLGAVVESYHPDFYGEMHDAVNAGDHSDRFVVRWDVDATPPDGEPDVPEGALLHALPEDIVALRADDPSEAQRQRLALRDALAQRDVSGITRAGEYVLVRRDG